MGFVRCRYRDFLSWCVSVVGSWGAEGGVATLPRTKQDFDSLAPRGAWHEPADAGQYVSKRDDPGAHDATRRPRTCAHANGPHVYGAIDAGHVIFEEAVCELQDGQARENFVHLLLGAWEAQGAARAEEAAGAHLSWNLELIFAVGEGMLSLGVVFIHSSELPQRTGHARAGLTVKSRDSASRPGTAIFFVICRATNRHSKDHSQ